MSTHGDTTENDGAICYFRTYGTVLQLVSTRNIIIHRTVETHQKSRIQDHLELCVRRCYDSKTLLTREDQEKVFYREEQDLIKEDHQYLKSWLCLAERTLHIAKRETEKHTNAR
jgi:hypothetical protein